MNRSGKSVTFTLFLFVVGWGGLTPLFSLAVSKSTTTLSNHMYCSIHSVRGIAHLQAKILAIKACECMSLLTGRQTQDMSCFFTNLSNNCCEDMSCPTAPQIMTLALLDK